MLKFGNVAVHNILIVIIVFLSMSVTALGIYTLIVSGERNVERSGVQSNYGREASI